MGRGSLRSDQVVGTGSLTGRLIVVDKTTSADPTLLHAPTAQPEGFDRISAWATNNHAATNHTLSILWGGLSDPADIFTVTILPLAAPALVIPGWVLQRGLPVYAFADTADKLSVHVEVSSR